MPTVLLDSTSARPTEVIYDPGNVLGAGVVESTPNVSEVAVLPQYVHIQGLAAGTTISVQGRVRSDLTWVEIQLVDGNTDTETLVKLDGDINFVQCIRSGAANAVVVAQK